MSIYRSAEKKFIIYKHTCSVTGLSYIGYTSTTLEKRLKGHLYDTKYGSNLKFHNALRKYNIDSFSSSILYVCFSKVDAKLAEIELIELYDTFINGYNMTTGGDDLLYARKIRKSSGLPSKSAIPMTIDNITYSSIREATKSLNVRADTLFSYLGNSENFTNIHEFNKSRKCIKPVILDGKNYKSLAEASKWFNIPIPFIRTYLVDLPDMSVVDYHALYKKDIPVIIDGIHYSSKSTACKALNITRYKLNSLL